MDKFWDNLPSAKIETLAPSKITGLSPVKGPKTAQFPAIFRVAPGYLPQGVVVRSTIDDTMFTGECSRERLEELEKDDGVLSVAVSEVLQHPKRVNPKRGVR